MPVTIFILGFHLSIFFIFVISAKVQSGSPGLLGIKIFFPPSIETILLTDINFTNYGTPDWEIIREAYLKAESVYLSAKNTYQAILDNPELDLGFTEAHYPAKFKHLITRAEQFLNTTVAPALEYTSRSNLTSLYARYSELNSVINQIKSIYPNIQIDEGDEATPY